VSAISLINVFYIVRKTHGIQRARQAVQDILAAFEVCTLDQTSLQTALMLPITDYEDAVQLAGALGYGLEAIVTRDSTDFAGSTIPVYSPVDFLRQLPAVSDPE